MKSKDLAVTIMFAVLNFVFLILIAQVPFLITGLPGVGYVFNVFYNITYSFSLLYYKGKRWLFFLQGLIFQLLTLVNPGTMTPTILVAKIPFIINVFIFDVVFNSVYGLFRKNNNLIWWTIIGQVYFWTIQQFLVLLFFSLFSISTAWFIPIMSIMLPIMMVEAVIGGYIGFRIYQSARFDGRRLIFPSPGDQLTESCSSGVLPVVGPETLLSPIVSDCQFFFKLSVKAPKRQPFSPEEQNINIKNEKIAITRIEMIKKTAISGFVKPGFEAVREIFAENFEHRNELGAACCIYHRGEKVVDLWGGVRNKATGEPWEENTMVLVSSATKGLAGLAMALGESRGLFDYDERISNYWPEFAQQGKEKITIRQLLAHQAGLFALDEHVDTRLEADLDRLAAILARQRPTWERGMRQAYHAITLGFYESELLRRVDPKHRSLGRFFHEEIASPLGLDFYIGLPEDIPNARLARTSTANPVPGGLKAPIPLVLAIMNPRSRIRRALQGELLEDKEHVYPRNLEVPSGGGIGTARAIAKAYGVFATGGKELGLRAKTIDQLMAPAVPPTHGFYDEVLKLEGLEMSLGFMKPSQKVPFAHPSSFGMVGFGGCFGFADPQAKIGFAYVPNRTDFYLMDPRQDALRKAMYRSIGETNPFLSREEGVAF